MTKQTKKQLHSNQDGIVAIIVAVTLTVLMSLMVLAISQSSSREQRQAIDRQLSDQAFYNAESGINDVANYLYRNIGTVPAIPIDKKECMPPIPTSGGVTINYTLPDASGVNKYTCLLYDKAPKTIQYDNLSISTPKVIPIQAVDDAAAPLIINSLTFSWDDATDRNANITGNCDFTGGSSVLPPDCASVGHGGLRVESITPAPNRDVIRQLSLSAFLLPANSGGSDIEIGPLSFPDSQGIFSQSNCVPASTTGVRRCSKTINGFNRSTLFLNLRSIYRPVNVTISGRDILGNEIRFKDTQIVIDSTGKASDVLRRLQVRIPANSQYSFPGFALQSRDSVCKVLEVIKNDDGSGNVSSADPAACPIN